MTDLAWALLGLTAVAAVVDWVAVVTHRRPLEYVVKPLTTLGLIAVAIALDPVHRDMRTAFVVALTLSLAGDVLLVLPRDRFVAGLAAFVGAHVAYTVGFVLGPGSVGELAVGIVVAAAVVVPISVRLLGAVRGFAPALVVPVVAYVAVIGAMVACATGWGNAWAIAGAWLFFVSDALIGETRFVRRESGNLRGARLAIIVTYHLGQAGLVLSLVHA